MDQPDSHQPASAGEAPSMHNGGRIVLLSRDLFFAMRVRTTLRQLDFLLDVVQEPLSFLTRLQGDNPPATLGLIDFNQAVDWPALAPALASDIPIIAFGPHKDVEGFRAARAAGVTRTVANGEFSRRLPDLIARYAHAPHAIGE